MKKWRKQDTTQKGPRPQLACLFSSQCMYVCVCPHASLLMCARVCGYM